MGTIFSNDASTATTTTTATTTVPQISDQKQNLQYRRRNANQLGSRVMYVDRSCSVRNRRIQVQFPPPKDININMMPFILGDINSLPEEYRPYWPMIETCLVRDHTDLDRHIEKELGKVCYLTIHECFVEGGKTQRRPGLHTDAHAIMPGDEEYLEQSGKPAVSNAIVEKGSGNCFHSWGGIEGGIFVASSLDDTCCAWDCDVIKIGVLGDCEELRKEIERFDKIMMKANKLYWIADQTPHESLPLPEGGGYRQFFRLVTSEVGLWYEAHSTYNPLGIMPACPIVSSNKFILK